MEHNYSFPLRRMLLASLFFLMLPAVAWAEDFEVGGIFYNINYDGTGVTVTHGRQKYSGDIVIPSTVVYEGTTYDVTGIGVFAFASCSSLTSISLPEGVEYIGSCSFENCSSLASVDIPSSVRGIGRAAFASCSSLSSMTVATGNPVYDSRQGCNAIIETGTNELVAGCQNTVIPEGVTLIGFDAFSGCSFLTSIDIPVSVTSIDKWAFTGCPSLVSVTVAAGNPVYDSRQGCNAIIETKTNTLVLGCCSTVIPKSVTGIGASAFSGCLSLTSISIPKGVKSIGDYAFVGCPFLASVFIPKGVKSIGNSAFNCCYSLTSISIPKGVESIGDHALANCHSLSSLDIPSSVKSIGDEAFSLSYHLKTVICRAKDVPECGFAVFDAVLIDKATLYVPASAIEAYKAVGSWKNFGTILPLEDYGTGTGQ